MCFLGVPVSGIGFGNLVNTAYPLFGILGFFQMFVIFKNVLEKKSKN